MNLELEKDFVNIPAEIWANCRLDFFIQKTKKIKETLCAIKVMTKIGERQEVINKYINYLNEEIKLFNIDKLLKYLDN